MKRCKAQTGRDGLGKKKYPTFQDAAGAALTSTKRRGGSLRPYKCESCKCWHLTGQPKLS